MYYFYVLYSLKDNRLYKGYSTEPGARFLRHQSGGVASTRYRRPLVLFCIEWRKIEALFLALGAQKDEGNGSAVTFFLNDKRADFHRPHPNKEALRYRVKAIREFLEKAGITP